MTSCLSMSINGREISKKAKPYIVAEMSGNHNNDIKRALKILIEAKEAGADAVKIQTYRADTITINHDSDDFLIKKGLWKGRRLFELYEEAHTPWEWHQQIFEYASKIGITVFSSPFDSTAVDFLENLGCPAYKIASPEIIDIALVERVAKTQKPIIISTGMATVEEIEDAISAVTSQGNNQIVLLQCTAAYPAPAHEANLLNICDMRNRFNTLVGLSDHTPGTVVATTSIALGAVIIEKHFTISRDDGGVDSTFSLEPDELRTLVFDTETAHSALGYVQYGPTKSESIVMQNRRSLFVVKAIKKGERITLEHVRSIRPGNGLAPKHLKNVIGKIANRDLKFGEPLSFDMLN